MSVSNLIVPNDNDLFCDSLTANSIIFAGAGNTSLSHYESGTFTLFLSGPWGSTSGICRFQRINTTVTLTFVNYLQSASSNTFISTIVAIPASLRPINYSSLSFQVPIINNGTNGVGFMQILLNGTINIYSSNALGNFTIGGSNSGLMSTAVTYNI